MQSKKVPSQELTEIEPFLFSSGSARVVEAFSNLSRGPTFLRTDRSSSALESLFVMPMQSSQLWEADFFHYILFPS